MNDQYELHIYHDIPISIWHNGWSWEYKFAVHGTRASGLGFATFEQAAHDAEAQADQLGVKEHA